MWPLVGVVIMMSFFGGCSGTGRAFSEGQLRVEVARAFSIPAMFVENQVQGADSGSDPSSNGLVSRFLSERGLPGFPTLSNDGARDGSMSPSELLDSISWQRGPVRYIGLLRPGEMVVSDVEQMGAEVVVHFSSNNRRLGRLFDGARVKAVFDDYGLQITELFIPSIDKTYFLHKSGMLLEKPGP